jgi:WD40-like Beta Propeller Repeat
MRFSRGLVALLFGLVGWLVWSPPATAQSGVLILADTSDTGVKANQPGHDPWLSADGTKVAFWTEATNLDPADTDSVPDVYVKDLLTGDITLASTSDNGIKGNGGSQGNAGSGGGVGAFWGIALSADGTKVAFVSTSPNLDPAGTTEPELYVKDLVTGDLTLAATSDAGVEGNQGGINPILSADGTRVGFTSASNNLHPADPNTNWDVYVKDLVTGDLTLVSRSSAGPKGNGSSVIGAMSPNGQRVVLASKATNFSPRDTDSLSDVYFKNLVTGGMALLSTSDAGVKGNASSYPTSLTGGKVAFVSLATNLEPTDADPNQDVYVKDVVTGDLTLVSTSNPNSQHGDAYGGGLSADGTLAVFQSFASNVDHAVDPDNHADVWVRDLTTGAVTLVSASEGGVKGNGDSRLQLNLVCYPFGCNRRIWDASQAVPTGVISADGSRVVFLSNATNLDPADTDEQTDIYVKTVA